MSSGTLGKSPFSSEPSFPYMLVGLIRTPPMYTPEVDVRVL